MRTHWVVGRGLAAVVGVGAVVVGAPSARAAAGPPAGVVLPQLPAVGPSSHTAGAGGGQALTGTFRATAGSCSAGISGSWFRMLSPAGSSVTNSDSPCSDQSYTPLSPGSDGGLVTGGYQPDPSPAFDGTGNGLAHRIFQPAKFYGVEFSVATDPTDPQTGTAVGTPAISVNGNTLGGDLRAFTVSWNNQHFNQGAPKPDGTSPGKTSGPTGIYNAATRAYKLTWSSQIVGGPFNNFTGTWQIEGTFVPASSSQAAGPPPAGTSSPGATGTSTPPDQVAAGSGTDPSATSNASAAPSLPRTGGNIPLLPAAALLSGGLVLRRVSRSTKRRRAGA